MPRQNKPGTGRPQTRKPKSGKTVKTRPTTRREGEWQ